MIPRQAEDKRHSVAIEISGSQGDEASNEEELRKCLNC